jgi:hypothetical protein
VTELSAYALSPLREGPFTMYRGLGEGLSPILLVAPSGEYPSPGSFRRLEHEYALRTDLGDWGGTTCRTPPARARTHATSGSSVCAPAVSLPTNPAERSTRRARLQWFPRGRVCPRKSDRCYRVPSGRFGPLMRATGASRPADSARHLNVRFRRAATIG